MATSIGFSVNTGLSANPIFNQKQYPDIWIDNQQIRNAIIILQAAIDFPGNVPIGGNAKQFLVKVTGTDYDIAWVGPAAGVAAAVLVGGGGAPILAGDTFDGYTLQKVVKALRDLGILA